MPSLWLLSDCFVVADVGLFQMFRVGTEEVVCVLRTDAAKGTIDVSKRRVEPCAFSILSKPIDSERCAFLIWSS